MKKTIALLIVFTMLLTLGSLFGAQAAEESEKLSCGENDFGAYLTVRENAEDHDARILLITKESLITSFNTLTYKISFSTDGGVKEIEESVTSGYTFFRSVTAAGEIYDAADGYVFFGSVITDIGYSDWSAVAVTVTANGTPATFTLDYADAIRKDMENLLGVKAEEKYAVENYVEYNIAPLAGYHFADATQMTNVEICEMRVPVYNCEVGDVLTVTAARWMQWNNAQIGDVRGTDSITYQLVAEEACDFGFVTFSGLSISVPFGYSIFVGAETDTVELLFLPDTTPIEDTIYKSQHPAYFPIDFYGYRSTSFFNEFCTAANQFINYADAPYVFTDLDKFSNSVVTCMNLPVYNCPEGETFTVSVVKVDPATYKITDTYAQHTLTSYQYVDYHWLSFDVDIYIPEGYTLAFGAPTDTMPVLYLGDLMSEYNCASTNSGNVANVTLAHQIFGYKCN